MDISRRIKKIEEQLDEGLFTIYLKDGSTIKREKKQVLDFIIAAFECQIHNKEPEPEYEFLLRVDTENNRNNKSVILARKMIENR